MHILVIYFYRQRLDAKLRFLYWFLDDQEHQMDKMAITEYTKKFHSYKNKAEDYEQLIAFIDKYLEKGMQKMNLEKHLSVIDISSDMVDSKNVEKKGKGNTMTRTEMMKKKFRARNLSYNVSMRIIHQKKNPQMNEKTDIDLGKESIGQTMKSISAELTALRRNKLPLHCLPPEKHEHEQFITKMLIKLFESKHHKENIPRFILLQRCKINIIQKLMVRASMVTDREIEDFDRQIKEVKYMTNIAL